MASDKRVMEYKAGPLGLAAIDGKSVAARTGVIQRLNRGHGVKLVFDVANQNDDGTAGGLMNLEFDLYDEEGANIIWSGVIADDIPIHVDLQGAAEFGGGVTAVVSDGTINSDADALQIFNQIAFRANVTVASNDTGTCVINVRALVQE